METTESRLVNHRVNAHISSQTSIVANVAKKTVHFTDPATIIGLKTANQKIGALKNSTKL